MSKTVDGDESQGLLQRFFSGLKFPQLFAILLGLFVVDILTPDPIVLVDEAILGVLAVMLGMWRRRGEAAPEIKNITPKSDDELR